jgi:Flp pilus assembly protein TadD
MRMTRFSLAACGTALTLLTSGALAQEACPPGCSASCCQEQGKAHDKTHKDKTHAKHTSDSVKTVSQGPDDKQRDQAHEAFMSGDMAKAAELLGKVCEEGGHGVDWFRLGYALHMTGDLDRALEAHTKATEYAQFRPIALYNVGCAHALQGHKDKAFEALERSAKAGFAMADHIHTDSDLDTLHSDDRWSSFVKQIERNAEIDDKQTAMDFMVGSWTLTFDGQEIGVSKIERSVDGNCITEDWESERYGMGKSLYFYDARSDKWRHVAIGLNAEVLDMTGGYDSGKMIFKGKDDDGAYRQIFARAGEGKVSLTMERKGQGSEQYTEEWTVVYVPRDAKDDAYAETAEAVSLR